MGFSHRVLNTLCNILIISAVLLSSVNGPTIQTEGRSLKWCLFLFNTNDHELNTNFSRIHFDGKEIARNYQEIFMDNSEHG